MRRKDREILDKNEIYKIMQECTCCRVGFYDEGETYIVPLNFGYTLVEDKLCLYFHSAKEGRKVSLAEKGVNVGFEMDTAYKVRGEDIACEYTASFKSIIGNGVISVVKDKKEKNLGMQRVMYQTTGRDNWSFNPIMMSQVCIMKIEVTNLSCKVHE